MKKIYKDKCVDSLEKDVTIFLRSAKKELLSILPTNNHYFSCMEKHLN